MFCFGAHSWHEDGRIDAAGKRRKGGDEHRRNADKTAHEIRIVSVNKGRLEPLR